MPNPTRNHDMPYPPDEARMVSRARWDASPNACARIYASRWG